jgi:hypothetical protein
MNIHTANRLTPQGGQTIPNTEHSREKVVFDCSCGGTTVIAWKNFTTGHINSCGKCSFNTRYADLDQRVFGRLKLKPGQTVKTSNDKVTWVCGCGNEKDIVVKSVVTGYTKSCGNSQCQDRGGIKWAKPVKMPKSWWLQNFPIVDTNNLPDGWSAGAQLLLTYACPCGNNFNLRVCKYKPGISKCGQCDLVHLKAGQRFGELVVVNDVSAKPSSDKRVMVSCSCGNTKEVRFGALTRQCTVTCGECTIRDAGWWAEQKFGRLKMKEPVRISTKSEKVVIWKCDCGGEKECAVDQVVRSGGANGCGSCSYNLTTWYRDNKNKIKATSGKDELISVIKSTPGAPFIDNAGVGRKVKFGCSACKEVRPVDWQYIKAGVSLVCGCVNGTFSAQSKEVVDYIRLKHTCTVLSSGDELRVGKYRCDIYLPEYNLVVEYNGARWHAGRKKHLSDMNKMMVIKNAGYRYMVIWDDDWKKARGLVERHVDKAVNGYVVDGDEIELDNCKPLPSNIKEYEAVSCSTPILVRRAKFDCFTFGTTTYKRKQTSG